MYLTRDFMQAINHQTLLCIIMSRDTYAQPPFLMFTIEKAELVIGATNNNKARIPNNSCVKQFRVKKAMQWFIYISKYSSGMTIKRRD